MSDEPSNVVPFHAPPTRENLDADVRALLAAIQSEDFGEDPNKQALAFIKVQRIWKWLDPAHQGALRSHIQQRLPHVDRRRFDYLVGAETSLTDMRRALRWRPTEWKPDRTELGYPEAGWLGEYLAYARYGHAHIGYHFWSGLAVLAAACRRNFWLDPGGHAYLFPSLYLLLEGPSGCGKSTAIGRAKEVLERANEMLLRDLPPERRAAAPYVAILPEKLNPASLVTALDRDAKRRTAPLRIEDHPQDYEVVAFMAADEMTNVLGRGHFGSEALVAMFTQLFDGHLNEETLGRGGVALRNVSLTCIFGSTMAWLRNYMNEQVFQGGFLGARCLAISKDKTRRKLPRPPPVDPVLKDGLAARLTELMRAQPTEMEMTAEAGAIYEEWFLHDPPPTEDERVGGYLARRSVHLLKLAMLLAVSEGHEPWIKADDMHTAIALLHHEEPSMIACYRGVMAGAGQDDFEYVEALLRVAGGHLTRTELMRKAVSRFGTRKRIDELLWTLQEAGTVRQRAGPKPLGGHPAIIYYLTDLEDQFGNRIRRNEA